MILLLSDTRHHRTFLRTVGVGFLGAFPIDGSEALERLQAGVHPGGNAIVLL